MKMNTDEINIRINQLALKKLLIHLSTQVSFLWKQKLNTKTHSYLKLNDLKNLTDTNKKYIKNIIFHAKKIYVRINYTTHHM